MQEDAIYFWKESVIMQICSGACSFAASSMIVTFIAINGLVTPYRRIIFGLSMSDMFQSFAIVAGPFLIESDAPTAIWGIGNEWTCQIDGSLFIVGMGATPMYTLFLCVYYVYKLKNRMTDAQFTERMEAKIHVMIIVINIGVCLAALGLKVINPSAIGNSCCPASVPTGCNQNPEVFGECDPKIQPAVKFFLAFGIGVVPVLTLVGIIICMGLILWHELMRERIFGTRGRSKRPKTRSAMELNANDETVGNGRISRVLSTHGKRRQRYLRSSELISYVEESSSFHHASSLVINDEECRTLSIENIDDNNTNADDAESKSLSNDDIQGAKKSTESSAFASTSIVNTATENNPQSPQTNDAVQSTSNTSEPWSNSDGTKVDAFVARNESMGSDNAIQSIAENWSNCGGISVDIFPSSNEMISSSDHHLLARVLEDNEAVPTATPTSATNAPDLETLSRLYKKELLLQICCYVLVFCLTTIPFFTLNLQLVHGITPSKIFLRINALLYPLAGFFNIIVYTRWNVASWRRKHPECSRIRAFYLVLKAGGDLPSEDTEVEEREDAS